MSLFKNLDLYNRQKLFRIHLKIRILTLYQLPFIKLSYIMDSDLSEGSDKLNG